jgi:hypothetical protein
MKNENYSRRISTGFGGGLQKYKTMIKCKYRHSQCNFADDVIYTEIYGDLS